MRVGDIETDERGNFVLGATFPPLRFFDDAEKMAGYIVGEGGVFYFHFLDFDAKYLFPYLGDCTIIARERKPIIIRGDGWELRDSFALLPEKLEKLTRDFDVVHKKLEMGSVPLEKYLEHDVKGLYEVLVKVREALGRRVLPASAGSLAISEFGRMVRVGRVFPRLPPELEGFARLAYYGGRVELFEPFCERVFCYDVNSMYPFVMRDFPYPSGKWFFVTGGVAGKMYEKGFLGVVCARVSVPRMRVAPLPYRRRDGKVVFPWGSWTGVYCSPELRFAEECGATVEVLGGVFWRERSYPFAKFVDKWYEVKRRGGSWRAIAKLILNSLYGKFGERCEREVWRLMPLDRGEVGDIVVGDYVLRRVPVVVRKPYHRVYVSAFVTCYARIWLGRVLRRFSEDVVYCDTDSVMLKRPLPSDMVGSELGQWKFEGVWDFIGGREKFYVLVSGSERRVKLKGAPRGLLRVEDVLEGLERGCVVVEGVVPNTFYGCLRGGGLVRDCVKRFVVGSDKRDGGFPPYVFEDERNISLDGVGFSGERVWM